MRLIPASVIALAVLTAAVNSKAAVPPNASAPFSPEGALPNVMGKAGDQFGTSLAIGADVVVAGAPHADAGAGAVLVFIRNGSGWALQQRLTASDGSAGDQFGFALASDGETMIVGAPEKSGARGAAYVFSRSGSTWTERQQLKGQDPQSKDRFGWAIALSSDTALVSETGKAAVRGAVTVFTRTAGSWSASGQLLPRDPAAENWFGSAVALGGDTALVSAKAAALDQRHAVYAFLRVGNAWSQQQKLTLSDTSNEEFFGASLAIDADTALIGAISFGSADPRAPLACYVPASEAEAPNYDTDGDGIDDLCDNDWLTYNPTQFSPLLSSVAAWNPGSAYVFVRTAGTWSKQQQLSATDAAAGDFFGAAVALSNDVAIVGAAQKNSLRGAAYVFSRAGTSWSEQQRLTAEVAEDPDQLGAALTFDGRTLVLGAPGKSSLQGAAFVFDTAVDASSPCATDADCTSDGAAGGPGGTGAQDAAVDAPNDAGAGAGGAGAGGGPTGGSAGYASPPPPSDRLVQSCGCRSAGQPEHGALPIALLVLSALAVRRGRSGRHKSLIW